MPFSLIVSIILCISLLEPVPDPTITPTSSLPIRSDVKPESVIASCVDKKAYAEVSLMNRSIFRSIVSKSGETCPETWHRIPLSM